MTTRRPVRATAAWLLMMATLALAPAGTAAAGTTDPTPPTGNGITATTSAGSTAATASGVPASTTAAPASPTGSTAASATTAEASTSPTASSAAASSSAPESTTATAETAPSSAAETTRSGPAPTVELPAVPPAAQRSDIGVGKIIIAVVVLLLAVLVIVVVGRRIRPGPGRPGPTPADGSTVTVARGGDDLMDLLVELGDAMVRSGAPVTHVQADLLRIAAANGVLDAEIVVLPTALIITVPGQGESRTEVAASGGAGLRLDQIDAVFRIAAAAEHGDIGIGEALTRLRAIRTLPPSVGPAVVVLGHAVIAVGLAIVLSGSWLSFPVAAVLGAAVGCVKLLTANRSAALQVFVPIGCAFAVSTAVALLTRTSLDPGFLPPVLGALVTFIPGGLLTTAVLELATGQMISGASRFIFGGLQLVLLAIGIVGGVQLVGLPVIDIVPAGESAVGAISPWLGVLVFGVGVLLTFSGRPRSLGWMLLVLYVAFAGQVLGGLLVGSYLSGFVGAAAMTPVAVFAAGQRSGPPTMVTFLPAFWLLVPGAVALVGVTQVMGDTRDAGVTSILTAGVTFVAIALGVVFGSALAPDWLRGRRR
jgi:uncharacterized membrane protein YjjP (DUF1212 family)